jgi:hypothetical protein
MSLRCSLLSKVAWRVGFKFRLIEPIILWEDNNDRLNLASRSTIKSETITLWFPSGCEPGWLVIMLIMGCCILFRSRFTCNFTSYNNFVYRRRTCGVKILINSRSYTHPSHSQTSRLLTSSLSLGILNFMFYSFITPTLIYKSSK